jgi:hypothetical protein
MEGRKVAEVFEPVIAHVSRVERQVTEPRQPFEVRQPAAVHALRARQVEGF